MTVIEFPKRKKVVDDKRAKLTELIDELNYLYDGLERAYQIVHKLEQDSDTVEKVYNEVLRKYVNEFQDHEQIEVKFLNYSTEANLVEDENGKLRIVFPEDYHEEEHPP